MKMHYVQGALEDALATKRTRLFTLQTRIAEDEESLVEARERAEKLAEEIAEIEAHLQSIAVD